MILQFTVGAVKINFNIERVGEWQLKRLRQSYRALASNVLREVNGMNTSVTDKHVKGKHNLLCECRKCLPSIRAWHKGMRQLTEGE